MYHHYDVIIVFLNEDYEKSTNICGHFSYQTSNTNMNKNLNM